MRDNLVGAAIQGSLFLLLVLPIAAHATSTKDVRNYIISASLLYESLDYEHALKQIQLARRLPRQPEEDVTLSLYEGIILCEMGKQTEGTAFFKSALLLQPNAKLPVQVAPKIETLFESLRQQANSGKTSKVAMSATSTESSPTLSEAETLRENAYSALRAKRFPEALSLTEKCIQSFPAYADCYFFSGVAHVALHEKHKAIARYQTFLRLAPKHPFASQVTAALKTLETRLNSQDAIELGDEALKRYNEKNYEQARVLAEKCIALNPSNPDCHMIAGAAHAYLGQINQTIQYYQTFLNLAPNHKLAPTVRKKLDEHAAQKKVSNQSP